MSPGLEAGTGIVWVAMLFGFKAAPLVMGRLSAAIGRLLQSLFHPAEAQIQVYIDDVAVMVRGSPEERNIHLAKILHVLAAFGVQISLGKGERGKSVTWIGTTFELTRQDVFLGTPKKMVQEIRETISNWQGKGLVATKELRTLVGRLSWVAGIVPRLRWTVTAMYAVLTSVLQEENKEEERAAKRSGDQRPKHGLFAVKRLGTVLPWLKAAFETPELMLVRKEPLVEPQPIWGVVTDASPGGLGGVLIHKVGDVWTIVEAFEAPVLQHQAEALEIEYNQASGQAVLEGLAILRALQIWSTKFQNAPALIRSDSSVALAMSKQLKSSTKTLNYIAAELSLLLERARIQRLVPQHVPGKLNVEADWLSRVQGRGAMPDSLAGVKLRRAAALNEQSMVMAPPGVPGSPWGQQISHPEGVFDSL